MYKYYVEPIVLDSGYNPVNTVTWALILGLFIILILRSFKVLKIQIDKALILCTIPHVLAGASLRVVEDANLISPPASYLLITPLIYFLTGAFAISSLLVSRLLLKDGFLKGYLLAGLALFSLVIFKLLGGGAEIIWILPAVLGLGMVASGIVYICCLYLRVPLLNDRYLIAVLCAHMLDASSTYIGVDLLGYHEKHVIPNMLIGITGTSLVMYPLKLAILLPILALLKGFSKEDQSLNNIVILALIVLGLAPAVRNTLRMTLGI